MKKAIPRPIHNPLVTIMSAQSHAEREFAKRLLTLRKARGWSQPELAKLIGTSGAIVGRYERGEMTPTVGVAQKLADALGVTLDYLVADKDSPNTLQDKALLARWQELESLPRDEQERILFVIDSLVRDAKARQAYRLSA